VFRASHRSVARGRWRATDGVQTVWRAATWLDGGMESLFDRVGGEETFRLLVDRFYAGVAVDPVLRPLYPDEDFAAAPERLRMFLVQYWGGPRAYQEVRGHPRLRMRHAGFHIGPAARDAWMSRMIAAVDSLELVEADREELLEYLAGAALMLQNQAGDLSG
jgi:hemoglobin